MKKNYSLILLELGLVLASVLIFRSIWTLLDQMQWARSSMGLWLMLVIGIALAALALKEIHHDKKP